jgi:hypothetical protein
MNLPPIPPIVIGVAGAPLAQAKGADVERAQQDTVQQDRQVQTDAKAEQAAGIGTTEEQAGADADRDADGRRAWEAQARGAKASPDQAAAAPRQSRDATGQSGTQLDLSG